MTNEEKNKRKGIIYLVIGIVTLIALIAGATYAYFASQLGNGTNVNISAGARTTDNLTFTKGEDINLNVTQENFSLGKPDATKNTTVTATLIANDTTNKTEEYKYNIYLEIKKNNLEYTSYKDSETNLPDLVFTNEYDKTLGNNRDYNGLTNGYDPIPELFLTVTDPKGAIWNIPGLKKASLETEEDSYDITELREGIYPIVEDFPIKVTADDAEHKKTDTWNIKVTFQNLDSDQQLNTNKTFNARIIIQAEKIANDLSDVCSEGDNLADCIKLLHDESVYGASNLIYHDGETDYDGEENYELEAGDNSYRYAGSYEKVNNYICFGSKCSTTPEEDGYDNLYRIVGTFGNDGIKLVKADYANKELLGEGTKNPTGDLESADPETDGSYTEIDFNAITGTVGDRDSFIHRYSNGKGKLDHVDKYAWQENGTKNISANWPTSLLNKIHLNNKYLSTVEEPYRELIITHKWIWINDNAIYNNIASGKNVKITYDNEVGDKSKVGQQTDEKQIGLLYASDYLYGASPKCWRKQPYNVIWSWNEKTGITDKYNNPITTFNEHEIDTDYRSTTDSNWLYMGLWEWILPQRKDYINSAFYINATGNVSSNVVNANSVVVRPTFYITNDAKIKGGTGTIDDPYTLQV